MYLNFNIKFDTWLQCNDIGSIKSFGINVRPQILKMQIKWIFNFDGLCDTRAHSCPKINLIFHRTSLNASATQIDIMTVHP